MDFSFTVSGKIWKVRADEFLGNLVLELRDEATEEVFFLLFSVKQEEVSEYFSIPGADWWSTLSSFSEGTIFLDRYTDPQDPGSRQIIEYKTSPVHPPQRIMVRYPAIYWQDSSDFDTVKSYIGKEIVLGVEYFELSEVAAFSYYLSGSAGFSRYLVIVKEGTELVHMKLEESVAGFAEGSFMIIDSTIVFITNSNQFNGIHF